MKKVFFLFVLLSFTSFNSYTQIWIDDFDGSNTTNTISTSTQCNNNGNSYFGIVCPQGGGCAIEISTDVENSYGPLMGNFLGARDTDNEGGGCGPVGEDMEFADWMDIDISSCTLPSKLYVCFDLAESDELPDNGWDPPSTVRFSVELDNGGLIRLGSIEQSDGQNSSASFDLDCDLEGDMVHTLIPDYTNYCFQIPGYGSDLRFRIDIIGLNQAGEDIAIDNVGIYCDTDENNLPGTLLLACGICGADNDCDGVILSEECDDNDPNNTSSNDGDFDCDGVSTDDDCDDFDASNTSTNANDADCDGVPTSIDCDDNDPSNTNTNVNDADCDGVPTSQDCDDNDPSNTSTSLNDVDCDGIPTGLDCDDNDPSNTSTNANDVDCDGIPTGLDCDDNDPSNTSTNANDADCDGVPTGLDCDDNDPSVGESMTDEECNDGDCTNGEEFWDDTNCECSSIPLDCNTGSTSVVPCDDGDADTENDEQTVLDCDGSICVPCQGTVILDECSSGLTSIVSCDDGDDCTINDEEAILDSDGTICIPYTGEPITEESLEVVGEVYSVDFGEVLSGNILSNDIVMNFDGVQVEIVNAPSFGSIQLEDDGSFEYNVTSFSSEADLFTYEVCLVDCPEICAEGLVEITINNAELLIPDAFSPNNDGKNDLWIIPGILNRPNNKLIVLNRWGNVIYQAQPYLNNWDGTSENGASLPEGTYYYYIEIGLGDEGVKKGSITIIR